MARNLNALILTLLVAAATLFLGSSAQTRHVVGDSTGWTIPSSASFYTTWAANKTFTVGDTLVFNFANGQHNAAKVSKSDFDSCSGANTISVISTSPATVTLSEAGEQHFICTVGGHCSFGQKLAVNVVGKASPAPKPSPVPAPKPSPVPAPKSSAVPAPKSISPVAAPAPAPTTTATPPTTTPTPAPSIATPPSGDATPPSSATTPSPSSNGVNPSSPSPSSTTAPPPKDSAARSLGAAGFFATTVMSVAVVFFF